MLKVRILLFCTLGLLFAGYASADIDCNMCDPYGNYCTDSCYICHHPGQDPGQCGSYTHTTCGDDRVMGGNCLQSGCVTNFQESSRVTVGIYGESKWNAYYDGQWHITFGCERHNVDRVTEHDLNQCNLNPYWWDRQSCQDVTVFFLGWYQTEPDCCAYYPLCNGYHSCS